MMPPLAKAKALPVPAIGGWMYSSLKRLFTQNDIEMAVATVYNGKLYDTSCIDNIKYYLIPLDGKKAVEYNPELKHIGIESMMNFILMLYIFMVRNILTVWHIYQCMRPQWGRSLDTGFNICLYPLLRLWYRIQRYKNNFSR